MSFVYDILFILLWLVLGVLFIFLSYFLVVSLMLCFKNRSKKKHGFKFKLKHKLWHIMNHRYIAPIEFLKWCIFDLLGGKDYLRLFGIWAFTGYYGEGKTMGCVQFAKHLQRKYPHRDIKIYSNINVAGQVKRITDWQELLDLPPNSIMIYDESQSDWSSNLGVGAFPEDFLRRITQVRKKQFALFMTSPKFNRMNINIRESVNFVIECKNRLQLDRWFSYTFYHAEDYEQYRENKAKLFMHKHMHFTFVVQNKDYRLYNTVEEVKSIKDESTKLPKKEVIILEKELQKFRNTLHKEMDYKLQEFQGTL